MPAKQESAKEPKQDKPKIDEAAEKKRLEAEQDKQGEEVPPTTPSEAAKEGEKELAEQKEPDKKKAPRAPARAMDDPIRVLARRAVEIAESGGASLGSMITAPQAEAVSERLGEDALSKLGGQVSPMLAFAQGGRQAGRDALAEGTSTKIREFCKQVGDRRLWPRKVAALTLALHERKTGKSIPGTKRPKPPEPEPDKGAEKEVESKGQAKS